MKINNVELYLAVGPEVEFFNPKLRHELEKKDAEILKRNNLKGAAPGDSWVWLTSYSRIPVRVFLTFLLKYTATINYVITFII